LRVSVEHVEEGLLGEVWHLLLYGLRISHGIALWKAKLWEQRFWCLVAGERESLRRDWPATIPG
jgi:hypothetical protein